jgi:hypothetical protein
MMQETQGVQIKGRSQDDFATLTADGVKQRLDVSAILIGELIPVNYDYISISYTGTNMTGVIYKTGGVGGTTVATLTLGYTGSNLTSVART